jgi:hypothetical protein
MTSGINLIIEGKSVPLADYLKMLEAEEKKRQKQTLGQQAKQDFKERRKETTSWISPKSLRYHYKPAVNNSRCAKVLSSRYLTPAEIEQQEEELMGKTADIQRRMIQFLLENPNQWFSPKIMFTRMGYPAEEHPSRRFALSHILRFLSEQKLVEIRPNPEGKRLGQVFLVPKGLVNAKDQTVMDNIYSKFFVWFKAESKNIREKAKDKKVEAVNEKLSEPIEPVEEENDFEPESSKTEHREEFSSQMPESNQEETKFKSQTHTESQEETWSLKGLPEKLLELVRNEIKVEAGVLNVKVQIDVRFGLLKD